MRSLFIVINFTIKDMIKRKAFLISNIIIFLMIIVGFNLVNWYNNQEEIATSIIILDNENIFNRRTFRYARRV